MKDLTYEEMIIVNGGHDGTAYELGRAAGKLWRYCFTISLAVLSRGRFKI